jgi:hypothetical protein
MPRAESMLLVCFRGRPSRGTGRALPVDAAAREGSFARPRCMSKLTEEHRRLHRLAGEWHGEEMIYPNPPDRGGRAKSRAVARVELDGFFVTSEYVEEREGAPVYRGHGVYGWDPVARVYTMHWFDSMGSFPAGVARGTWKDDGSELSFEHRTTSGYARYAYRFTKEDVYLFQIANSRDGRDWRPFLEGKYKRVP